MIKSTYIFGAGASIHAGYPLATRLGEQLIESMCNSKIDHFRETGAAILERYGSTPDVESLMAQLKDDGQKDAIYVIGFALAECFSKLRSSQASAYAKFAAKLLRPSDSLITFNYDEALDRELAKRKDWSAADGYGFSLTSDQQPSSFKLLKLHGSVNWRILLFEGNRGSFAVQSGQSLSMPPLITEEDLLYLGADTTCKATMKDGAGMGSCLILPFKKKEFYFETSFGTEYEEFWNHLWSQALLGLRASDSIILRGYSLPEADRAARELILHSDLHSKRVTVICGTQSKQIARTFSQAGFSSVEVPKDTFFENWVATTLASRS